MRARVPYRAKARSRGSTAARRRQPSVEPGETLLLLGGIVSTAVLPLFVGPDILTPRASAATLMMLAALGVWNWRRVAVEEEGASTGIRWKGGDATTRSLYLMAALLIGPCATAIAGGVAW